MNLRKIVSVLALFFFSSAVLMAQDQKRGPSTPEERAQAVKLTRFLEQSPLHEDAQAAVRWLLVFYTEVPDISIGACVGFLPKLGDKETKKKHLNGLFAQMIFSQGAFVIENPDSSGDDHAIFTAGLEGALKSYESIVREDPKSRQKDLDRLIELRDSEGLGKYVTEKMAACK